MAFAIEKRLVEAPLAAALSFCLTAGGLGAVAPAAFAEEAAAEQAGVQASEAEADSAAGVEGDASTEGDASGEGSESGTGEQSDEPEQPSEPKPATSPYSTAKKKGSWKLKNGKKLSYRYKDGSYPTRIAKIGKKVWCFKAKGVLSTSGKELRIASVNGNKHGVLADGSLASGWQTKGGNLYYFTGTYLKGKASGSKGSIRFAENGMAKNDLDTALKVKCMKVMGTIASPNAKRSTKLRAIWRYTISRSRFRYATPYTSFSFLNSKSWAKRCAYEMLCTKKGNCYSFATMFAALAYEAGYTNVKVVNCRVQGSRDRAADGYTHHGLVKIAGRWYDAEAQFAGWATGIYGRTWYPIGMKSAKAKLFSSYVGSGAVKGISASFNSKVKLTIVKKGSSYYGTENQRVLTGLRFYQGHLYKFDSKGKMKVTAYKKLQKAIKYKKSWKALKRLIGKPDKSTSMESCEAAGNDVVYFYDHVVVSTFKPAAKGKSEYVTSVGAR